MTLAHNSPPSGGFDEELWPKGWDAHEPTAVEPPPTAEPIRERTSGDLMSAVVNLPEDFWRARERFRTIRLAAWRNGCSGDVAFLTVLTRTSAMVSPKLVFDLGRGTGSLNLIGGAIGPSGAGKTQAVEVGQDIVIAPAYLVDQDGNVDPQRFKDGVPLGSGEGLAEAYMGIAERETGEFAKTRTKTHNIGDPILERIRAQVRHHVFYYLDEGETLTKMMRDRKGTTIGQVIRTAWVGGVLGQQNVSDETTRLIAKRNYALGMMVGYQPETVQDLLADGGPGTPQRFLWMSAIDPALPMTRPDAQRPFWLPISDDSGHAVTGTITGPQWIADELWGRRVSVVHGKESVAKLDSHVDLMRCKVASLLAVIDNRMVVNEEDWQLAEVIWQTSCTTRDRMVEFGNAQLARESERTLTAHVEREERAHVARRTVDAAVERVARGIAKHIHEDGAATRGAAKKRLAGRDKHLFEVAASFALEQGWLVVPEEPTLTPGNVRPA